MKRVLFVLSHDHGELFNAMYFVMGTDLEAVFALPLRLYQIHGENLPYPTVPYTNAEEILALADEVRPDAVLLFSAYLFVINRILDLPEQRRLHEGLAARDLPIATTDPSVGVLLAEGDERIARNNPGREWLLSLTAPLADLVSDLVHLYLSPAIETSRRHYAFFNPASIPGAEEKARIGESIRSWNPVEGDLERWLFILSPEDFELQVGALGLNFWDQLEARILETVASGRQPILLAPRPCIERLKQSRHSLGSMVAFSGCDFTLFMRLLHEAEHVFYWNAFSASILARVLAGGSLSFFDEGHLVHTMPPFRQVGLDHFYRGCQLPMRRFDRVLDAEEVREAGDRQAAELQAPLVKLLSGGQDPLTVLEGIVSGRP